jgi:ligand-binding sensor domain-containing protein/serine phosphatase RsbU (regulator of sigma subunit)
MAHCSGGIKVIVLGLLLLLLLPHSTQAHNGAVAIAVPVEGIIVDGDLSDWPEGMRSYSIERSDWPKGLWFYPIAKGASGDRPEDEEDFLGFFRIGYSAAENALYLAVEMHDQSIVLDGDEVYARDGIVLFLDLNHEEKEVKSGGYSAFGTRMGVYGLGMVWRDIEVGIQRGERVHRYEWRVDVEEQTRSTIRLRPAMSLGLGIALRDQDGDESFSWIAWGPNGDKSYSTGIGDVVLVPVGPETGSVRGRVLWEAGGGVPGVGVQLTSSEDSALWVRTVTDSLGSFAVEMPDGRYRLAPLWEAEKNPPIDVELVQGGEVEMDLVIRPSRVQSVATGKGRTVLAGSGRRQGAWQTFGVSDGFPAKTISAILQDRKGSLWFGSGYIFGDAGLLRYDGVQITTFTTEDGLIHNGVECLLEDREGNLWIGTRGGVSRFDGKTWTNYTEHEGLAGNIVRAILQDGEGKLWFGTDGGVNCYDGETWVTYTTADGLAENLVVAIEEDAVGGIWFGTWNNGVSRYDEGIWTAFTSADGLVDNNVVAIERDHANNMWFLSRYAGISRYDGKEWVTFTTEDGLPSTSAGCLKMVEDRAGHIWVTTWGAGVSRYDGETWTTFTSADGLANDQVFSVLQDREGTLWFGAIAGGVSRFDEEHLVSFSTEDGLAHNLVFSVLQDRRGHLWCGTVKGVNRYDGEGWTTFTTQDGLPHNTGYSMLEDRQGRLWVASPQGAVFYDGEEWTIFADADSLIDGRMVSDLLEDRQGHLWIGGDGLVGYDGERWIDFTADIGGGVVNTMLEDRQGRLWFGGSGIVSVYDGGAWTHYTPADGFPRVLVIAMAEDRRGNILLGTKGDGLVCYDGTEFVVLPEGDPLTSDETRAIIEDQQGHIWFGTWGEGVIRYDGTAVQTMHKSDGLPDNLVHDIFESPDSTIWIATEGGVLRYRSAHTPPQARLVNVTTDRSYGVVHQIDITSDQDYLLIEFKGASLRTRPDGMVYLYRLLGQDEEWRQTRQSKVEYDDLPLGEYTFQVKAVDQDLNYSEPVELKISVTPPYAQLVLVGGFSLALLGLAVALMYGLGKGRDQRRAEQALMQELEAELQTAHDMQMGLMPTESPKISGFDIAGRCLPAKHVGGDFFQYFPISDNRLAISLADVTGHAMEAAVPVMMFSGILDTQMETRDSLENLFARLNRSLHRNLDSRTFVCFAMGELDTETRILRISNGGCPYPYHYRAASGDIAELQVDAYPLGVRAEATYPVIETQLESGDRVVFCSDGIIEAENSEEEMFGFEKTAETIRKGCQDDLAAPQLLDHLISEVKSFTGDTPQGDDQTVVVLGVEA